MLYNGNMNDKIFRKGIIDRLSNPEQLDRTVSIIKPYHWGILLSFGILFIGVLVWSFVGNIPEKVNGTGYIMPSDGYISIHYGENATVKNVFVNPGDLVSRGTIIARMERQDLLKQLNLAQQKVDDAEKIYMQSFDNAETVNEISKKYQSGTASDTKAQIRNIEIQIEDFKKKEAVMKELCNQGVVSENEYLQVRSQLFDYEKRKQDLENQMLNITLDTNTQSGERTRSVTSALQQLTQAKKEFEIIQEQYERSTKVVSNYSGIISEISIRQGDYVQTGSTIAAIQTEVSGGSILEAKVYFQGSDGKKILKGMNIGIVPSTTKQEEYGFIRGIVTSVSEFAITPQYLNSSYHNQNITNSISQNYISPIEVTVSLIPNPNNYSGYEWSSSRGPKVKFTPGMPCTGMAIITNRKPIELLLPSIRKNVFGIGEAAENANKH